MMVNRRNDEERWWVVLCVVIDGTPLLHLPERWVGLTHFFLLSVYIASFFLFDLILMNREEKKTDMTGDIGRTTIAMLTNIIQGYRDKSFHKDRQNEEKMYLMIICVVEQYQSRIFYFSN